MTPNQLRSLGEQLGQDWQEKLASRLPCDPRTIQYWLSGGRKIRPIIAQRIRDAVQQEKDIMAKEMIYTELKPRAKL